MTNISFFTKVGAANVLLKINYLQSTVETHYTETIIYHTKQYQTFYRKIKCDLLNFRGAKNGYYQDFQCLMVSIHFSIKWQRWCKVLCLINCNHEKKKIFWGGFFWSKDLKLDFHQCDMPYHLIFCALVQCVRIQFCKWGFRAIACKYNFW